MRNIKEINRTLLFSLVALVFATSYFGVSYLSAQTEPVYYCKVATISSSRYFACSTNPSFTVSSANASYSCEISNDDPACATRTVSYLISTDLGDNYCLQGWVYYPSSATPSSNFTCSTPSVPGSFDFSFSNGGDKSVRPGDIITNIITVVRTAGTATPISFNVSELPPESTATVSPTSCTPSATCTATITVQISPLTPPGVYPVTITGVSEAPGLDFPDQSTMAFGYCNGNETSFYGKISINNGYSSPAVFTRMSFDPILNESAPSSFTIPANTIFTKAGFGNLTYADDGCNVEVPGNPYGTDPGSATYSVTVNGTVVDSTTYSWSYPI